MKTLKQYAAQVFFLSRSNGISSEDPELVYSRSVEMNRQQAYRDQDFMLDG